MSRPAIIVLYIAFMILPGVLSPLPSGNPTRSGSGSHLVPPLMAQEAEHGAAASEHTPSETNGEAGHAAEGEHAGGEGHSPWQEISHYFNFLVLAGALIYLIKKMLAPYLTERGRLIREDMQKSAEAIEQAKVRLAAMEARMGNLDRELAELRTAGINEARAERERIEREAETEATKILNAASMEMDSAVKAARQELQAFASELALSVAEKKIKDSMTPQSDQQIFNAFVDRLAGGSDTGTAGRKN